jgi:hypothetical protein
VLCGRLIVAVIKLCEFGEHPIIKLRAIPSQVRSGVTTIPKGSTLKRVEAHNI